MIVAAPVVFAACAALSAASPWYGRRFPDADDFAGYYICNLAAGVFALEVARSGSLIALIYGGGILLPLGGLLTLEAVGRIAELVPGAGGLPESLIVLLSLLLWMVLFGILITHAARPYRRARRVARGLCASCGYDVRHSPDRCPECGTEAVQDGDKNEHTQV